MVKKHKNEYQDANDHPTALDEVLAPTPPSEARLRGRTVLKAAGLAAGGLLAIEGGLGIAQALRNNPKAPSRPASAQRRSQTELVGGPFLVSGTTEDGRQVIFDSENRMFTRKEPSAS